MTFDVECFIMCYVHVPCLNWSTVSPPDLWEKWQRSRGSLGGCSHPVSFFFLFPHLHNDILHDIQAVNSSGYNLHLPRPDRPLRGLGWFLQSKRWNLRDGCFWGMERKVHTKHKQTNIMKSNKEATRFVPGSFDPLTKITILIAIRGTITPAFKASGMNSSNSSACSNTNFKCLCWETHRPLFV